MVSNSVNKLGITELYNIQDKHIKSHSKLNVSERIHYLVKLKKTIQSRENEIYNALKSDLNKPKFESYATEIGFLLNEISLFIKNLKEWAEPESIPSSIINFPSKDYIYKEPYGKVLIISPWNYPFQLSLLPAMSAFACGNNVILKPSEHTPATSNLVKSIVSAVFPANVFSVVEGDAEVASELLKLKWDYIFFTGSVKIGKIVAKAAAINLTPTTLELGGKSPTIIDDSLDMKLVSKRIVWGKFLNSGQTCVAPDYLIVHESIKDLLIKELINSILEAFGKFTDKINNYTSIVNENNFDRLVKLINESKVIFGGQHDRKTKFIYPTLVDTLNAEDNIMIDEIFGPILPILTYNCQDDIDEIINKNPNPLALYVFTKSKEFEEKIINRYKFGGGAVNDTIVHLANPKLPFGGIGNSGYGSYHGKYSFELFTHNKSIVKRATWYDNKLRYAPYAKKFSLMKKIIKYFG
tara:strand:+ start:1234 stop:2634 length:1401 start_codon:yes stop_codon:yes gene_type:complete